ncbi:Uma2 family endonuclease [Candidatus Obscuribacterales bacterium]|nr:Uma2 family endonuclease [Candidatus Obscuribacterales bacterium]
MSEVKKIEFLTAEGYLASERKSTVRREFVDGLVFTMSGANQKHNVIAGNLYRALSDHLDETPCLAFIESFKVRIQSANCFYYPDVVVACSGLNDDIDFTEEPVFIAEVLSPSTAVQDRREKLINYLNIDSLRTYLILHQKRKRVETYQRSETGGWELREYISGETIHLKFKKGDELSVDIDRLYRNTTVPRGIRGVSEEIAEEYTTSEEEEMLLDY